MKRMAFLIAVLSVFLLSLPAFAAPFTFGWAGSGQLQGVLDGVTTAPAGNSSVNVDTDALADGSDAYWSIQGSGISATTMVVALGGYAPNLTFGVYSGGKYVQLFGTGTKTPGATVTLSILLDGSVLVNGSDTFVDFAGNSFGYYIDSRFAGDKGGLWHSDTSLNIDKYDHMAAYQGKGDTVQIGSFIPGAWGPNEYLLAFEDLPASITDGNFTDLVVMVESVVPTPEPMTLVLLGSGLLGLAAIRRKK